ncbi:MAG: heme ABC exporter ATP-binding protein CcmA [Actinomycetota bacterium]|nr:heme ABC exporter ATP-binding protein CcmA [Actinomycetota bacterium]
MIHLRGLTVSYGTTMALRPTDLTLYEGVTGLFGPNGSGKSTLLRVLAGLLAPSRGFALLEDTPIRSSDESIRRRIGYVSHSSGLYGRLTVGENLTLFGRLYGVASARVDEVLELLDLNDRRNTSVGHLSAGLKRRAAVARAVLHEPDVLLLDEPYANLDDDASARVSDAVKAWRAPGRAAIIATHGAKRVKTFADASLIVQRGRVISYRRRTETGYEVAR